MFKIEVTDDDITNGLKGCNNCCPLAIAVGRLIGGGVRVSNKRIMIDSKILDLPVDAQIFIRSFDSGLPVKPQTFTIQGELPFLSV